MSSGIRADRKLVGQLTHGGSWRSDLQDKLPLAVAWYTARHHLRSLAVSHTELIGRYAGTELPDVPALQEALAHAESVHRLVPETVADSYRRGLLATQVADARTPEPELLEQGASCTGSSRSGGRT